MGIVLDGELVYARAFGVQNVQTRTPVDTDTVFHIASLTKSFTALAVMKLRDEGKLALDEPLEIYLELSRLLAEGPSFASTPGTSYGYSNLCYALPQVGGKRVGFALHRLRERERLAPARNELERMERE